MSKYKHTPGEWRLSEELNENLIGHAISVDVLDSLDFPVACVHARPIIHDWPSKFPEMDHWADGVADGLTSINRPASEVIQNARLIAAAPELLDALRELVACKRMKEQIAIQQGLVIETDEDMEEMDRIMSDYARRQPKAWENAALILAKATGATHE